MTYYFTFGPNENFPYRNGWVKISAKNEDDARDAFAKRYGHTPEGFLPCAFVYDKKRFKTTSMPEKGNFNAFCHDSFTA